MPQRHEWAHGWWEVVSLPVHPLLRDAALGPYVGWREHTSLPAVRREVAGTTVPFIVTFDGTFALRSGDGGAEDQRGSFVAGVYDRWIDIGMPRDSCAMQINLTPIAARRLFGVPLSELMNRAIDIEALFGCVGRRLIEQLGNTDDWCARARLFDAFLLDRLQRAPQLSLHVMHSWHALVGAHGNVRVRALNDATGWSPRRLGDAFRDACGMTPRQLATVLRFQRATDLVRAAAASSRRVRWSEIAADCGYADHAHMSRAFRQFAGQTPSEYGAAVATGGVLPIVED